MKKIINKIKFLVLFIPLSSQLFSQVYIEIKGGQINNFIKVASSTVTSLPVPPMVYPTNNATNIPIVPKFIIGTVPQADRYEIQVGFDQYFFNYVSSAYWQFDLPLSTDQLNWFPSISNVADFKNNAVYYWRVRCLANNQTEASPWSQPYSYKTTLSAGPLDQPILINPANYSIVPWVNIINQWSKISNANWYQIQWSTSNNFNGYEYRWANGDNPIKSTDLKPTKSYYWRVVAFNDNSISQFSPKGNFQTGNQVLLTENEFTFDDGSGVDNYENNLDIFWLIKPKNSKQIRLLFSSFSTEKDYDFVTIYDGATINSPIIGKFSGSLIPTSIKSSQGTILIRFQTDWDTPGPGWRVHYESFVDSCDPIDISNTLSKVVGPWQSEYDGSFGTIAVSSSTPNLIFIGSSKLGGGIYKSTDYGLTWSLSGNGIKQLGLFTKRYPPISKIIIHPQNHNIVFLSTVIDDPLTVGGRGDIYKSMDGGENWFEANGTKNILGVPQIQGSIYDFAVDPLNSNILYVGATSQGVFKTTDGGSSWKKIISATVTIGAVDYFNVVKTSPSNGSEIYVSGFRYYSEAVIPLWIAWDYNTLGIPGILPLSLKKSIDGGSSWVDIGTTFTPPALVTDLTFELSSRNIFTSTIAYQTPVYITVGNKGIFQSSDYGKTWFQSMDACQESLSQFPLLSLSSYSDNQKNLLATTSGFQGLYISTTGGNSWNIVKGLPSEAFIVGCTLSGSKNYVVTSKGIYTFTLLTTDVVNEPNLLNIDFTLQQNYPNPFNPITTIKYSIPSIQFVTLKVYDILGSEVAMLVNEEKLPGNYQVVFNVETFHGTFLPSGVYFYRLQAGSFSQTKKLLLLK